MAAAGGSRARGRPYFRSLRLSSHLAEAAGRRRAAGDLAAHVGIEGTSLVRLLDQVCEAGLVVRRDDLEDRRAKTLWLTGEGEQFTERIERTIAKLRRVSWRRSVRRTSRQPCGCWTPSSGPTPACSRVPPSSKLSREAGR